MYENIFIYIETSLGGRVLKAIISVGLESNLAMGETRTSAAAEDSLYVVAIRIEHEGGVVV